MIVFIIIIIGYLTILSIIDLKKGIIENKFIFPLLIIIFIKVSLFFYLRNVLNFYMIIKYIFPISSVFFVYFLIGLIGSADFKIIILILLYYNFNNINEISNNLDGYKFLIFFSLNFFFINFIKYIRNLYLNLKLNYSNGEKINYYFYNFVLLNILKVKKNDQILLKDKKKSKINVLIYIEKGIYGWVKKYIPLIPSILLCFILSIIL